MKNLIIILSSISIFFFIVSCEKEVFTEVEEEVVIDRGKVFINSNPQGAAIFYEGRNMGYVTPATLNWIKEGYQRITLKKENYRDTTFTVIANSKYESKYFINFLLNSNNYGKIECTSSINGASIILNDSITGKSTPAILSHIIPGIHKVKLKHPDCRDDSSEVLVQSSMTARIYVTLEDTSKWVSYLTSNSGINSNYVKAIASSKKGNNWIGTGVSLQMFDGKKWTNYSPANSILKSGVVNILKMDNEDRLWIGTEVGLYAFKDNIFQDYSSALPSQSVTAIKIDKDVIWVGTRNGLLKMSNSGNQVYTTFNSGLKDDYITAIEVDDAGNKWVGGLFNGVSIFDGEKWEYFNNSNIAVNIRFLPNYVQAIFKTSEGKMLVSLTDAERNSGYLLRYDGEKWIELRPYLQNRIYDISSNGREIIFATQAGLVIYKNDFYYKYQFGNTKVILIKSLTTTFDSEGNIWVGTFDNGMAKFKKGNF
jgi:hypothetical protein